jgi:hypothetical protein
MRTLHSRVAGRELAEIGLTAGLIFAGFAMVTSGISSGTGAATDPLRMVAAIVLGPTAVIRHPFALASTVGLCLHLLLSTAFARLFAVTVTGFATATEGELMTTTATTAIAGIFFGAALWLMNFYIVAPLAGWTWFPANVHHVVAFVGHAFFFGLPLGWLFGRAALAHRRGVEQPTWSTP